jgi:hypothetical protein
MVLLVLLLTTTCLPVFLRAQANDTTRGWKSGGQLGVNITNVGFSNWAAGGQNTLALTAIVNGHANWKSEDLLDNWDNSFEAALGGAQVANAPFRKSDDRFIIVSKYTHKIGQGSPFGYSGLLDLRTQFAAGFDFAKDSRFTSAFLAPAFGNLAIGGTYKPSENFSLFVSPMSGRLTIVGNTELSNRGEFGVRAGESTLLDFGGNLALSWRQPVMENITFSTRLNLFRSYNLNHNNAPMQYLVVNWETVVVFVVNKYINVSFETQFIFDERVRIPGLLTPAGQFRNTLAIGFVLPF